jgi:uncharacterized protein YndB with AHSA1/START domain
MSRAYAYEQRFAHPVDAVWQAISQPERLNQWYMRSDFKPVVGHKFRLLPHPEVGGDPVDCEVLEVTPPRRLVYRWKGGPMMDSIVTWELSPVGQETLLRVTHGGINQLKGYFVTGLLGAKWRRFDSSYLDRLRDHLK